jgi:CreA protein
MWWKVLAVFVAGLVLGGIALWFFADRPRGDIGAVSTNFRWLGPNDKVVVDGFDDPDIGGVACHISRAQRGGIAGGLGFAEDPSDASIACRQIGPIVFKKALRDGEKVFDERRSAIFKSLQVVRFFDAKRNVLVYVSYSDRILTGSPKNAISSVPLMPWGGMAPQTR